MSTAPTSRLALRCSKLIGALVAAGAALGAVACGSSSSAVSCVHDTDCPSNFCKADGTCAPVGVDGGGSAIDAPAGSGMDGGTGACTPNHDGHISADELPLIAGRMANFRVATNATFDTAGSAGSDGSRSWDLTPQLSGDATVAVTLISPTGAYWASDFPGATYATPLAAGSDLLGVFSVTTSAVELLGVVSPSSGGGTNLSYSPAARILQLPFSAGDTWTSTSTVTGTLNNIFGTYTEKYTSRVDQVGTMKTPYGAFPVLRVATDLADSVGVALPYNTNRTFAWVAECFGTVATVRSQSNETGAEFTSAAEVRRLAP